MSLGRGAAVSASTLRQLGEPLLDVVVPAHRLLGVAPAALHFAAGGHVGFVTVLDDLLEMLVLRLDDLVGALALVGEPAGAAEVLTSHGLHKGPPPLVTPAAPGASRW